MMTILSQTHAMLPSPRTAPDNRGRRGPASPSWLPARPLRRSSAKRKPLRPNSKRLFRTSRPLIVPRPSGAGFGTMAGLSSDLVAGFPRAVPSTALDKRAVFSSPPMLSERIVSVNGSLAGPLPGQAPPLGAVRQVARQQDVAHGQRRQDHRAQGHELRQAQAGEDDVVVA